MKKGKITQVRLMRSVLKKISYKSDSVSFAPGVGRDCSRFITNGMEEFVFTANPVTGKVERLGERAFYRMANDLVCAGAKPVGIMIQIFLPECMEEKDVKTIMKQLGQLAEQHQVDILGGHTEWMSAVNEPMIAITGFGAAKPDIQVDSSQLEPGMSLVMTKWAGMYGVAQLAEEKKELLRTRLPEEFITRVSRYSRENSCIEDARIAILAGARALHNASQDGIFGALWEMAEASGTGLEVNLTEIPIRQEAVEICEFFDINPYEADSEGVLLAGTADGEALVSALARAGIPAAVIGRATANHDRIILHGEERRFLNPPGS